MRRRLTILAVLVTACGRLSFETQAELGIDGDVVDGTALDQADPGDPSLRLWLELDAIPVVDSSADSVAVSCGVAGCPTLVPGIHGSAARFANGTVLRVPGIALSAFTYASWSRLYIGATARATLAAQSYGGGMLNTWEIYIDSNGEMTAGGDSMTPAYGGTQFTADVWHHVAFTWDGTTTNAYFDGVSFIDALAIPMLWDGTELSIGGDIDNGVDVQGWIGEIDDVRIYDRVLAPGEITALATP